MKQSNDNQQSNNDREYQDRRTQMEETTAAAGEVGGVTGKVGGRSQSSNPHPRMSGLDASEEDIVGETWKEEQSES